MRSASSRRGTQSAEVPIEQIQNTYDALSMRVNDLYLALAHDQDRQPIRKSRGGKSRSLNGQHVTVAHRHVDVDTGGAHPEAQQLLEQLGLSPSPEYESVDLGDSAPFIRPAARARKLPSRFGATDTDAMADEVDELEHALACEVFADEHTDPLTKEDMFMTEYDRSYGRRDRSFLSHKLDSTRSATRDDSFDCYEAVAARGTFRRRRSDLMPVGACVDVPVQTEGVSCVNVATNADTKVPHVDASIQANPPALAHFASMTRTSASHETAFAEQGTGTLQRGVTLGGTTLDTSPACVSRMAQITAHARASPARSVPITLSTSMQHSPAAKQPSLSANARVRRVQKQAQLEAPLRADISHVHRQGMLEMEPIWEGQRNSTPLPQQQQRQQQQQHQPVHSYNRNMGTQRRHQLLQPPTLAESQLMHPRVPTPASVQNAPAYPRAVEHKPKRMAQKTNTKKTRRGNKAKAKKVPLLRDLWPRPRWQRVIRLQRNAAACVGKSDIHGRIGTEETTCLLRLVDANVNLSGITRRSWLELERALTSYGHRSTRKSHRIMRPPALYDMCGSPICTIFLEALRRVLIVRVWTVICSRRGLVLACVGGGWQDVRQWIYDTLLRLGRAQRLAQAEQEQEERDQRLLSGTPFERSKEDSSFSDTDTEIDSDSEY
ncbi:MAG: hypothetical protein MHM6MM_002305 [Cercozoa sp. M6MM]